MSTETLHPIGPDILEFFARKGKEGGEHIPQTGNDNGVKVRRIMQIVRGLATKPMDELSVLDLACGEGVYAIETALRGARVLAVDARTDRMNDGIRIAKDLGLTNLRFEQNDVRKITVESHGEFDIVYCLGMLYHLDVPDAFHVLENLHEMCRDWLVIDTHFSRNAQQQAAHKGRTYQGTKVREHEDSDSDSVRKSKLLMSIDNTFSFQFSKESLTRLLTEIGFSLVFECHGPPEPFKPENRITLVAGKGQPVTISTYPWVNCKTEDEIEQVMNMDRQKNTKVIQTKKPAARQGLVDQLFGCLGYEIRRIKS